MIQKKLYYRSLNLRKGQEALLSQRLKQVEEEIIARHFGIEYKTFNSISFEQYIDKYVNQKQGKGSLDRDIERLKIISNFFGTVELNEISKRDIQNLEKHLFSLGRKASTVNRYFELLRHFFNLAIEDKYLTDNPVSCYIPYAEYPTRIGLYKDDLKVILSAAWKIQGDPHSPYQKIIYNLILLALNTGMRFGEIINLKESYIRDRQIFFPISQTKHKRRQLVSHPAFKVIPLNYIAMKIIEDSKSKDDFIFPMPRRDTHAFVSTIARIRKLSGIGGFCFHQLRHTASTLVTSVTDLGTAKELLGHSDLKTTLKYTHPGEAQKADAVAKLGTYFESLLPKELKDKKI
jgi:integrase